MAATAACVALLLIISSKTPEADRSLTGSSTNGAPATRDSTDDEGWYQGQRARALHGDILAMTTLAEMYGDSTHRRHDAVLSCAWLTLLVHERGTSARAPEKQRRSEACTRLDSTQNSQAVQRTAELERIVSAVR